MRSAFAGVSICLLLSGPGFGQPSEEAGFSFYTSFQGNSSSLGQVMRLDPSVGYRFNRFLEIDLGLPFYFVRPSAEIQGFADRAESGLGNLYTDLRLSFFNPVVNYGSTLTVTAPTGDRDKGLSTGEVTWSWNNHFNKRLGRVVPFLNAGVANTITDTPFFIRPYVSRGFVSHVSGGASWNFARVASLGASAYAYEPSGEQTVFSRVVRRPLPATTGGIGRGRGRPRGVFETVAEITGPAEIARDRGFAVWLDLIPNPVVFLEAGYSRSTTYALDTVFWNVGVNVRSLMRKTSRQ